MDLIEMIIITLQITSTFSKKKHKHDSDPAQLKGNSDESIENLLYYKDCKHKKETPSPVMLRVTQPPPTPPACPCPRMCCSMCCDCNAPMPFVGRQMAPLQTAVEPIQVAPQPPRRPQPQMMVQPQIMQRASKRKKPKIIQPKIPEEMMQPPIGSRRDLGGFTRENIKNLISHDQDIKKILKDLVRVTMTKVDLVEAVNARRNMEANKYTTKAPVTSDQEEDYYSE